MNEAEGPIPENGGGGERRGTGVIPEKGHACGWAVANFTLYPLLLRPRPPSRAHHSPALLCRPRSACTPRLGKCAFPSTPPGRTTLTPRPCPPSSRYCKSWRSRGNSSPPAIRYVCGVGKWQRSAGSSKWLCAPPSLLTHGERVMWAVPWCPP